MEKKDVVVVPSGSDPDVKVWETIQKLSQGSGTFKEGAMLELMENIHSREKASKFVEILRADEFRDGSSKYGANTVLMASEVGLGDARLILAKNIEDEIGNVFTD